MGFKYSQPAPSQPNQAALNAALEAGATVQRANASIGQQDPERARGHVSGFVSEIGGKIFSPEHPNPDAPLLAEAAFKHALHSNADWIAGQNRVNASRDIGPSANV